MKKVALLTLDSHSYNYGGALQQYALLSIINSLGFDCEIIDYDLNSEVPMFSYKRNWRYLTFGKIIKKLSNSFKILLSRDQNEDMTRMIKLRHDSFEIFRERYIFLSQKYSRNELKTDQKQYRAFVCGSDQIWNPELCYPSFFLDFVDNDIRKTIYAASLGKAELSKIEKNTYREYLKKLNYISVREDKAKSIINHIVSNKDVTVVLDPTLLIEREEWENIAGNDALIKEKYVFCYYLELNQEKRVAAIEFSKAHGVQLVSIPFLHEKYNKFDDGFSKYTDPVGPIEFLNLILYADYVLTDSYHASVFSILFNKRFRVFGRGNGKNNMNSRIETLLGYIRHNEYLLMPDVLMESNIELEEQYDIRLLNQKKEQSIRWLYNGLK